MNHVCVQTLSHCTSICKYTDWMTVFALEVQTAMFSSQNHPVRWNHIMTEENVTCLLIEMPYIHHIMTLFFILLTLLHNSTLPLHLCSSLSNPPSVLYVTFFCSCKYMDNKRFECYSVCKSTFERAQQRICQSRIRRLHEGDENHEHNRFERARTEHKTWHKKAQRNLFNLTWK